MPSTVECLLSNKYPSLTYIIFYLLFTSPTKHLVHIFFLVTRALMKNDAVLLELEGFYYQKGRLHQEVLANSGVMRVDIHLGVSCEACEGDACLFCGDDA